MGVPKESKSFADIICACLQREKSIVFAARAEGNFPLKPLTRCLLQGGQTNIRGIYEILYSDASGCISRPSYEKIQIRRNDATSCV